MGTGITESRRSEGGQDASLEEQLAFERCAFELSSQFINLSGVSIASVFGEVLARQQRDEAVRAAAEAQRVKDALQVENVNLRREARERLGLMHVVGRSAAVRRMLDQIEKVAATDSTVLLLGETGDRQGVAGDADPRARHTSGPGDGARQLCGDPRDADRKRAVRTGERGVHGSAGTSGRTVRAGQSVRRYFSTRLAICRQTCRSSCCACWRSGQIERLGSPRPIAVDTRIIAATHRNLEQRISEGTFREDLYYRLNVFPIVVPPLRERVRGHSAARVAIRGGVLESVRQARRRDRQGQSRRRCSTIRGRATSASCATSSSAR